ncbi:MAG: hypothetical protein AAGE94_15200, partial [Acidobacteriota bacterium]
ETGAYIKTWCATLVFLPILCLRSYLVADAEDGGWYFLGRMPLSDLARAWNAVLAAGLVFGFGWFGWTSHQNNPEVVAERTMAEAVALEAEGDRVGAAMLWADVIRSRSEQSSAAETHLARVLDAALVEQRPGESARLVTTVTTLALNAPRQRLSDGLFDRGSRLVEVRATEKPRGSLELLDALAPLAPEGTDLTPRRRSLLEAVVVAEPDDPGAASKLAVLYEAAGEVDRLEALLAPHADHLGAREGARILGQIDAAAGRFDRSRKLLLPYTEKRLERLRRAEATYAEVLDAAWDREIERLEQGYADVDWYPRYDAASEADQNAMVQDWVGARLREDAQLGEADAAIAEAATIVPTAFDLGMIMLQRTPGLSGEARRLELEAAERVFLGIQGIVGENDDYQLALGQVYYWLGREDDGAVVFDALLAKHQRSPQMLLWVGYTLREIGSRSEALKLAEEAYAAAPDGEERSNAATLRALLTSDERDRVTWLERADPAVPETRASLETARGHVAVVDGRRDAAAGHYRRALVVYDSMVETASSLNNAALVHFNLFNVSGDRRVFHQGVEKMERALALMPQDSILIGNVATVLEQAAMLDTVGDRVDLVALESGIAADMLRFLYGTDAERSRVYTQYRQHPSAAKARELWQRAMILVPKGTEAYASMMDLAYQAEDEIEILYGLHERLDSTVLDVQSMVDESRPYWQSDDAEAWRQRASAAVDTARRVLGKARAAGGVTTAIADIALVDALKHAHDWDLDVDLDEMVSVAERAHSAAPSVVTAEALQAALLFRATALQAKTSERWASWREACRRSLDLEDLAVWVIGRGGAEADALIGDADVQRAIELVVDDLEAFPRSTSTWNWRLLSATRPELAATIAGRMAGDETARLRNTLQSRLVPISGPQTLRVTWQHQMLDRPGDPFAALRQAIDLGMPFPADLLDPPSS